MKLTDTLARLVPAEGNVISVNRSIAGFCRRDAAKATGAELAAAIMLSQLLYWRPKSTIAGGWIAKTDREFAEELCVSVKMVPKAARILTAMGIVEKARRRWMGSPTCHYRIREEQFTEKWEAWQRAENKSVLPDMGKSISSNEEVHSPDSGKSLTETTAETTPKKPTPPSLPGGSASAPVDPFDGFDDFWREYGGPRKVAKKQCREKWRRLDCARIKATVLGALRAAQKTHDWTKEGGQFIPAPLVWLNQSRWEAFVDDAGKLKPPKQNLFAEKWVGRDPTPEDLAVMQTEEFKRRLKEVEETDY